MEDTEGTLYLSQIPSVRSRSRISQAKIPGSFCFSSLMKPTTWIRKEMTQLKWNVLWYDRQQKNVIEIFYDDSFIFSFCRENQFKDMNQ